MSRKWLAAVCIAVLISLFSGRTALADQDPPDWEIAFDPAPYMPGDYYLITAVEEFNNELFLIAGDPSWFHTIDPGMITAGQVFHSPDGVTWEPATETGFGLPPVEDPYCGTNYYDFSLDMEVFKGSLYATAVDSCYALPGLVLRMNKKGVWEPVLFSTDLIEPWGDPEFPYYAQFHKFAVYEGMLYVSVDYYNPETEFTTSAIFRSSTGASDTWEEVMVFPGWMWPGSFHVFQGALYIDSDTIYQPPDWTDLPEQIWRTFDGVNWEVVVPNGFGNSIYDGMGGFADYKGYLYVGATTYEVGPNQLDPGGQIWRSSDGTNWELVMAGGFGNPENIKVDGLLVYRGDLCAYTLNPYEGGSLFCSKDAQTWLPASEPGWGNPNYYTTHLSSSQVVFKDDLYLGMFSSQGTLVKLDHP